MTAGQTPRSQPLKNGSVRSRDENECSCSFVFNNSWKICVRVHPCSGEHERTPVFALYMFGFVHPWQGLFPSPWEEIGVYSACVCDALRYETGRPWQSIQIECRQTYGPGLWTKRNDSSIHTGFKIYYRNWKKIWLQQFTGRLFPYFFLSMTELKINLYNTSNYFWDRQTVLCLSIVSLKSDQYIWHK